jgi:hypothetical protein
MTALNLSLLREKIVVLPADAERGPHGAFPQPLAQALSNRMSLTLYSGEKAYAEKFVIRAHTMHLTTRLAAEMLQEFQKRGFLAHRLHDHQWEALWQAVCSPYEVTYNPRRWATVYHMGRPVFKAGDGGSLLDAIEARHASESGAYEHVLFIIQDAFEQAGKNVRVDYDANIGMVSHLKPDKSRCSLILRGAGRTTTFNFMATPREGDPRARVNMPECLIGCAAFLEGVQISFTIGSALGRMERGEVPRAGDEARMVQAAQRRMGDLNREVGTMERLMAVRYRPERPEFQRLIVDIQDMAARAGSLRQAERKGRP